MAFGPRVIGPAAFAAAQAEEKRGHFGPRVVGAALGGPVNQGGRVKPPSSGAPPKPDADSGLSIDQILDSLRENPVLRDTLFEAELARPSGPRDDALRVLKGFYGPDAPEGDEIEALLATSAAARAGGLAATAERPPEPDDMTLAQESFAALGDRLTALGVDIETRRLPSKAARIAAIHELYHPEPESGT